jgi:FtsP/CotA-like multicopper oxidase with cupredoxin domain
MESDTRPLALLIVILISFSLVTTPDILGAEESEAPPMVGHMADHEESQLACTADDSTLKRFSLTAEAVAWEFTAGVTIDAWTYGGAIPGPALCANVGDTIEVTLTNDLDVPVSFHVHLPEIGSVGDVAPGETGVYSFNASAAGTYLYHDTANGVGGLGHGLQGALIVRDGVPDVDHEIVVILGEFQPDYHPGIYAAIINGHAFPWLPMWNFIAGERVAVHLLNAGPSEEHTFHIHGHRWLDADEGRAIDNKFLSPHAAVHHPDVERPEGFVGLGTALAGDVAVFEFSADATGEWMYHCHIYDHINAGMMGHLMVEDAV